MNYIIESWCCKLSCGIYKIENKISSKVYIGQSINIERRWKRHISSSKNENNKYYNSELYIDFRKYSINSFNFEIIEYCENDIKILHEREKYWIEYYKAFEFGYNNSFGAGGTNKLYKNYFKIVDDLKDNLLTYKEIANKYNISMQTLTAINTGRAWYHNIKYPIRESHKSEYQKIQGKNGYYKICERCGGYCDSHSQSNLCRKCFNEKKKSSFINESKIEEMKELLLTKSYDEIGVIYNITEAGVRKRCKIMGLPFRRKDLKEWRLKNK